MSNRTFIRSCQLQSSPGVFRRFVRGDVIEAGDVDVAHWFVVENSKADAVLSVAAPVAIPEAPAPVAASTRSTISLKS